MKTPSGPKGVNVNWFISVVFRSFWGVGSSSSRAEGTVRSGSEPRIHGALGVVARRPYILARGPLLKPVRLSACDCTRSVKGRMSGGARRSVRPNSKVGAMCCVPQGVVFAWANLPRRALLLCQGEPTYFSEAQRPCERSKLPLRSAISWTIASKTPKKRRNKQNGVNTFWAGRRFRSVFSFSRYYFTIP